MPHLKIHRVPWQETLLNHFTVPLGRRQYCFIKITVTFI